MTPLLTSVNLLPAFLQAQQSFLSAEDEATLNTLQLWFITGASLMLVLLVLWQILSNNRRSRMEKGIRADLEEARKNLEDSRAQAEAQAQNILKEAELKAGDVLLGARQEADRVQKEGQQELEHQRERLRTREDALTDRLNTLQKHLVDLQERGKACRAEEEELQKRRASLESNREELRRRQEKLSGSTAEEIRTQLLSEIRREMASEEAAMIRRQQEENRQQLQENARRMLLGAMQRLSSDSVRSGAVTVVALPNEEMKGRIIGKEGRNIRTLEQATGTNLLVDDVPQSVVISCFDPIRREVARRVLEKLMDDGRIHPSRVEELVAATREELDGEVLQAGKEAAESLSLFLSDNLLSMLGRLAFRYSFSQNVLQHSLEVGRMAGTLAAEMGMDAEMARRAGLLHDIGKAADAEAQGTHAALGAEILRRAGEDPRVINAVAAHHDEVPQEGPLAVLVQVCDTLSAARPGARSESTEFFLKRLENLERIGNSFEGVESCYALQGGRELRVLVKPQEISQEQAQILARDMAGKIQAEMRYPGQIRVTVIRETRCVEYAR
jgi:ribonucrease Y